MTTIRLPEDWTRFLLTQPEQGMGYQRVDVRLRDGRRIENALVFNAEQLSVSEDVLPLNPRDIVDIVVAA